MAEKLWQTLGWRGDLTALIAGMLIPLSLAPYDIWPLSILAPATLAILLNGTSARRSLFRALLFGLGVFGFGASWVYVSIHDFGFTGAPLAVVMTTLFVSFLALVFALPFYFYGRFFSNSRFGFVFVFPAIWTLGEWLRSWLFTGFPWLFSGYTHTDTVLASWAPLTGIFGLSFFSALSATVICHVLHVFFAPYKSRSVRFLDERSRSLSALALISLLVIWAGALVLSDRHWTSAKHPPQTAAIMQPNVPLMDKWNPYNHPRIMDELDEEASAHWDKNLQIWPEAAIPSVYHDALFFIDDVNQRAVTANTNVFSGVLYDNVDTDAYDVYNGIVGFGQAEGIYFKQKLVPFGEYVPFERQLRGLIAFFDLPSSIIRRGPFKPDALSARTDDGKTYIVTPLICYEVVYPDFVAKHARNASLMLTISNDAWFGHSIGPLQHFQMARMRAIENQKPLIRATNTGVSAFIDADGNINGQSEQFVRTVLSGQVQLRSGLTPFAQWGSRPVLTICFILLGLGLILSRLNRSHAQRHPPHSANSDGLTP